MQPNQDSPRGLIAWFAQNHVAANIFMLFLIIAGLASVFGMQREIFPTIDPRLITISVPYPGASPEDVEEGVTRRVGEALIGVQGVKRVASTATEGFGVVTVELEDFVDDKEVLSDVETEVDRLVNFPPENAEEVTIVKAKPLSAVLSFAVYGDVPEKVLREWAERIEDELLQLPDVSLVEISGGREREIAIEVPEANLRKYNITLQKVAEAIRANSIDLPAGTLRTRAGEVLVRVQEKRYFGREFEDVVILAKPDGSFLRLGEIATIHDAFTDAQVKTLFNNEPALFIDVKRSESVDTMVVEQQIKEYLTTLELPKNLNVSLWKNRTDVLRDRINLLSRNAIMGFTLVFIALLLFLDLKLAFWTSIAIPISFLGGIFIASLFGVTINMVTLFGLIVVLGIVVDDAIIAGESIFSEQERGKKDLRAVLDGIGKVRAPVTIGVLTTVAAFAPLIFSTGTLGQILQPIPIAVICILLVSLFEAFFILPSHLSSSTRWSLGLLSEWRHALTNKLEWFVDRRLLPFGALCITYRYATAAACAALVIVAFGLIQAGIIKFVFFPQIEGDELTANLEMQVGTPYEVTEKHAIHMLEIADSLRAEYDAELKDGKSIFKNVAVTIGATQAVNRGPVGQGSNAGSHLAQINIELVPSTERPISSGQLEREWRNRVGDIPGARKVAFASSLVRGQEDINIELSHRNENVLEQASERLKLRLQDVSGVSEVTDSYEEGKREFVFDLTEAGRAAGLTPALLGRQLRDAFYGREVQRIQRGGNELKVLVRLPEKERETLATIQNFRIRLPSGEEANLATMANLREQRSPASINRVDGRRVVAVLGNTDESVITPNEAIALVTDKIMPEIQRDYPALSYALEGQSRDQRDDLSRLGQNLGVGLMLIFVMLASQLRSYIKPFIIIMTVPVGIAGAIYGHLLLGFDLSFVSLFGIVALSGVVINDSVVLMDYYNTLVEEGEDPLDAALLSLRRRFRPILLTTVTTSMGLLPILLETSLQAQFIVPMAVSLACGLLFASTVLIFMIPSLLIIAEDGKRLVRRITASI